MKASKGYFWLTGSGLAAISLVCLVALYGQFHALERASAGQGTEKRALETLRFLHAGLSSSEQPEEAKARMKSFEALAANGPDSGAVEKIRRAYGPALATFAGKPREAEPRYALAKKRELMEALVNAYRKEIPNGDIRLRAAYLNILFDTQSSLLNEEETAEQVYSQRTKERMDGLHAMTTSGDPALQARVANLQSIFEGFTKGLELSSKWKTQKKEAFASVEKSLPKLARELRGKEDDLGDYQRGFLYCCGFAAVAILGALLTLVIGHSLIRHRTEARVAALLRFLKEFGSERTDPASAKEVETLREDPDWAPVIHGAAEAEASFMAKYQSLIAVPRSMHMPYVVFSREKVAQHWNELAGKLLGLEQGQAVSFDDLLSAEKVDAREGEGNTLRELIRNSFSSVADEVYEIKVKEGEEWTPVELLASSITSGPLTGGKLYLFRPIRSEAARVDQAVANHLKLLREYVQKITNGTAGDGLDAPHAHAEVLAAVEDLQAMRRRGEERESLWKSETEALLDQVVRQRDILERQGEEIRQVREAQVSALDVVGAIQGNDETWHDEVCVLERDLERYREARRRLEVELGGNGAALEKARVYENEVRASAEAMRGFLGTYREILAQLERFSEEAKVHSVNLSFIQDPGYWEFASRSRAYAHEIGNFVDQAADLARAVELFVSRHPGTSLAPHLERGEVDKSLLQMLKEEEERFAIFVKRWKESGSTVVQDGERALEMLRKADKQTALATQLGETILLINQQAAGNLARWH